MKRIAILVVALFLILACSAIPAQVVVVTATPQQVVSNTATPVQPVIVVVTATPQPATQTPYPTYTSYPTNTPYPTVKPTSTTKAFSFVSAFIQPHGSPGCNYYITGDGFKPNIDIILETVVQGYAPVQTKGQTDGNGHFSYMIGRSVDLGALAGLRITTTAYDQNKNSIAEADETVPNVCDKP